MRAPLLALLLALGPGDSRAPGAVHDIHASHLRLVLEDATVAGRIRLFHDDLQLALRVQARDSALTLTRERPAAELFQRYLAARLTLEVNGRAVPLTVTDAGAEQDPQGQLMMWYVVEGEAPGTATRVVLRQAVLCELFEDQQNIVQLLRMPGEERRTLYFAGTDPRAQALEF